MNTLQREALERLAADLDRAWEIEARRARALTRAFLRMDFESLGETMERAARVFARAGTPQ